MSESEKAKSEDTLTWREKIAACTHDYRYCPISGLTICSKCYGASEMYWPDDEAPSPQKKTTPMKGALLVLLVASATAVIWKARSA